MADQEGHHPSQQVGQEASLPKGLESVRVQFLTEVSGNIETAEVFFDKDGGLTDRCINVLRTLALHDAETGEHLIDRLTNQGNLTHAAVEDALQKAFFKPNESKFSFEINSEGDLPSEHQKEAFRSLNMIDEIRVAPGASYDCGVVFGGLLTAIDARTSFLLDQGAEISSIALLGSQRKVIPDREGGEHLEKVIGETHYAELAQNGNLPKTEFELMKCVWESHCRRDESLRSIPVIEVNSEMRLGHVKEAPGTPDTVVDLLNTFTSGYRVPGLEAVPSTFLLSSSQPHAVRQREDFLASMTALNYPGNDQIDVVGYGTGNATKLKLFASEVTKFVHAQFLARYK
jgi:hypothetical protein